MLAADKLLLQSNLRQNAIKLKEKVSCALATKFVAPASIWPRHDRSVWTIFSRQCMPPWLPGYRANRNSTFTTKTSAMSARKLRCVFVALLRRCSPRCNLRLDRRCWRASP